jgi:hypothetical protein
MDFSDTLRREPEQEDAQWLNECGIQIDSARSHNEYRGYLVLHEPWYRRINWPLIVGFAFSLSVFAAAAWYGFTH